MKEGCHTHHISARTVGTWWEVAREQDAVVSICLCCFGPAPVMFDDRGVGWGERCKHCEA